MRNTTRVAAIAASVLAALFTLTGSALAAAPANDDFANAQVLTSGVTVNGAATEATREVNEPQPNGSWVETVWYRVNVPAQGVVSFKVCSGNGTPTWGALYKGTALTNLTAATESSWNPFDCSYSYRVYAAAAGPIYLQAYFSDAFTVKADFNAAPANDNFVSAQTISGNSASIPYDNTYASYEPGELADPANNRHSVWFKWTAPADGTITATACVPSTDDSTNWPKVTLYSGTTLGGLSEQASGDNNCDLPDHDGGRIDSIAVTAGTVYHLKVNTFFPTEGYGPGALKFNFYPPAVNGTVATATDLGSSASVSTLGSNFGVTEEPEVGEPQILGDVRRKSVWFKWTAPKTGEFRFDQCEDEAPAGDIVTAAFTSNAGANPAPSNLVPVPPIEGYAGDDNCGDFGVFNSAGWFTIGVTAGTTYWIAVANYSTNEPGRAFSLRISDKTLANTTAPVITGNPLVGQELSVSEGEWSSGGEPIDVTYQWGVCDTLDTCVDLSGETGSTLSLTLEDHWDLTVYVVVTAKTTGVSVREVELTVKTAVRVDLDGDADGVGNESDNCEGQANEAPKTNGCPITPVTITNNPSISGLPLIGSTLTFNPGAAENANSIDSSTPAPTSSVDWKSCAAPSDYATCVSLGSAASTYSPTAADAGRYIRVRERWSNGDQTQTLVTNAIGPIPGPPVTPGTPDPITLPKIGKSLGTIKAGKGKVTLKKLKITCAVACTVNTSVTGKLGKKKLSVKAKLAIKPGKVGTIVFKLSKSQLKLIKAAKKLKAKLALTVSAPGSKSRSLRTSFTLKP